jgi:hypothetical protein
MAKFGHKKREGKPHRRYSLAIPCLPLEKQKYNLAQYLGRRPAPMLVAAPQC